MKAFTFHYDDGHGWLEIHIYDAFDVGLDNYNFSSYSYRSGQTLFLEEDRDASIFIKAYESHGRTFKATERYHGSYSDIRNCDRIESNPKQVFNEIPF